MLKYLIWQLVFPVAITYKNSLKLCFFKYFFVKYFKYLFENAMLAETVILAGSLETVTYSPRFPTLPSTLILPLRNSAKLVVLKTLSSTGLEQSIVKVWLTFFSWATLLLMVNQNLFIIIFDQFIHFLFSSLRLLDKFLQRCEFPNQIHKVKQIHQVKQTLQLKQTLKVKQWQMIKAMIRDKSNARVSSKARFSYKEMISVDRKSDYKEMM